jgi:uncharacterized membrane protein
LASAALIYLGRLIRRLTRTFQKLWSRKVPNNLSAAVLGIVTTVAAAITVIGLGFLVSLSVFSSINNSTAGQTQPQSPTRSGSPESLISWQSLGNAGRDFVSGGPDPDQITAVTARPALDPIRTYAGLESAESIQAQANLLVADTRRAGGFDRSAVIVYTPAANGLVDPIGAAAAEYVLGGDVTSVSLQYTVLPSSISFLVSQHSALNAGEILLATFRQAIDDLPPGERPRLFVAGESLGAFGSQAPFSVSGVDGFLSDVQGALWVGPPAASTFWQELSAQNQGGTVWAPIVDNGAVFRFVADESSFTAVPDQWGATRGVYLQNATDPVVWWDTSLIANRPGWLDSPRGPQVPATMRWFPLLTFELVFLDMPAAVTMPPGVGHNYEPTIGPAWVAVLQPTDWSADHTARLLDALK